MRRFPFEEIGIQVSSLRACSHVLQKKILQSILDLVRNNVHDMNDAELEGCARLMLQVIEKTEHETVSIALETILEIVSSRPICSNYTRICEVVKEMVGSLDQQLLKYVEKLPFVPSVTLDFATGCLFVADLGLSSGYHSVLPKQGSRRQYS